MSKFSEQIYKSSEKPLTEVLEEKLDKESLADFYEALKNTKIAIPLLVSVLKEFEVETSVSVLQRWRKGDHIPNTIRRRK